MATRIPIERFDSASQAMRWAEGRGVLPTALGSRALRREFADGVRARSVFMARGTNAVALRSLAEVVDRALAGGYDSDLPQLRMELQQEILRLGYTPETGFPGDTSLGIPPAEPGSLQDLSSRKRLDFVLDTQIALARGASQRMRGLDADRLQRWPAWELVRVQSRRVPRGSEGSNSVGWQRRWLTANGPIHPTGRLVALKTDPVWARLGSPDYFDDALGVESPPFAFQSGMGWREISLSEARELGLMDGPAADTTASPEAAALRDALAQASTTLPDAMFSDEDMPSPLAEAVTSGVDGAIRREGRMTFSDIARRAAAEAIAIRRDRQEGGAE